MKHTKTRRHSQRQKNIRKQYSGWKEIPAGNASEEIVQGCLVLEGGAFRGLYSQGVLDALMENGINMSCTIGVRPARCFFQMAPLVETLQ